MTATYAHRVVLIYHYVDDIVDRQENHRAEHMELIRRAVREGDVIMGGGLGEPVHGAMFICRDTDAAWAFMQADPYVMNELVVNHEIAPLSEF